MGEPRRFKPDWLQAKSPEIYVARGEEQKPVPAMGAQPDWGSQNPSFVKYDICSE